MQQNTCYVGIKLVKNVATTWACVSYIKVNSVADKQVSVSSTLVNNVDELLVSDSII